MPGPGLVLARGRCVDRTPRSTLVLVFLLAALVAGLAVLALVRPRSQAPEVHTQVVLEMVAALDGLVLSVGHEPGAAGGAALRLPWELLGGLGACVTALWLLRRSRSPQHEPRSRRS